MVSDKYMELIHNEIDNLNSSSESARFRKIIEEDQEACAFYNDLKRLSKTLSGCEEQEAPENLKYLIMNSIPRYKYAASKRTSLFEGTLEGIKAQFSWRQTYSFATGIAAGVLLFAIYTGGVGNYASINNSDITGSIISNANSHALGTVIEKRDFSLVGVSGSMTTRYSENQISLEFFVSEGEKAEFVVGFDSNTLSPAGAFKDAVQPVNFSFEANKVEITLTGQGSYSLIFDRLTSGDSELDIQIMVSEEVISEKLSITRK